MDSRRPFVYMPGYLRIPGIPKRIWTENGDGSERVVPTSWIGRAAEPGGDRIGEPRRATSSHSPGARTETDRAAPGNTTGGSPLRAHSGDFDAFVAKLSAPPAQINLSGQVYVANTSLPVCTLVLANGQSQFSCGGVGNYALKDVPVDTNHQITLFAWAEDFPPYKTVFGSISAAEIRNIHMQQTCPWATRPLVLRASTGLSWTSPKGSGRTLGIHQRFFSQ
jgi:hypothetical protein